MNKKAINAHRARPKLPDPGRWADAPTVVRVVPHCPKCGAVETETVGDGGFRRIRTTTEGDGSVTKKAFCEICKSKFKIVFELPQPGISDFGSPNNKGMITATTNLQSTGNLCATLRISYSQLEAVVAALGIEADLAINGIAYLNGQNCARIADMIRQSDNNDDSSTW